MFEDVNMRYVASTSTTLISPQGYMLPSKFPDSNNGSVVLKGLNMSKRLLVV